MTALPFEDRSGWPQETKRRKDTIYWISSQVHQSWPSLELDDLGGPRELLRTAVDAISKQRANSYYSEHSEIVSLRKQLILQAQQVTRLAQLVSEMQQLLVAKGVMTPLEQEGTASTRLSADIVQKLNQCFNIPEQENVLCHVEARPGLAPRLIAAREALPNYLDVEHVALVARGDDRLMLIADCDLDVDDGENRLTQFRREWWQLHIAVEDRVGVKLRYI